MSTIAPGTPLSKAIAAAGGASALSRLLNITPQAVLQWDKVPPNRVLDVERHTGVSRHELRPDIFGAADNGLSIDGDTPAVAAGLVASQAEAGHPMREAAE